MASVSHWRPQLWLAICNWSFRPRGNTATPGQCFLLLPDWNIWKMPRLGNVQQGRRLRGLLAPSFYGAKYNESSAPGKDKECGLGGTLSSCFPCWMFFPEILPIIPCCSLAVHVLGGVQRSVECQLHRIWDYLGDKLPNILVRYYSAFMYACAGVSRLDRKTHTKSGNHCILG